MRHENAYRTYLNSVKTWQRKRTSATRGFTNIANGKTAENQTDDLELMLRKIASYCPVIDRNIIIEDSKCITDVWKAIRLHFNFQKSTANFIDLADFTLEADERPEDLYQRMMSFIRENLLKASDTKIKHYST